MIVSRVVYITTLLSFGVVPVWISDVTTVLSAESTQKSLVSLSSGQTDSIAVFIVIGDRVTS
jgi:hypothetical protein